MESESIVEIIEVLTDGLIKDIGFYGYVEIDFIVDKSEIMLEGINWGLTDVGSSLFYF